MSSDTVINEVNSDANISSQIEGDSEFDSESESEGQEKPGLLKLAFPFIATVGIFWWILSGIDVDKLQESLSVTNIPVVLGVMLAYSAYLIFFDTLSFGYGYKTWVDARASWKDISYIQGTGVFLTVLFPPLAAPIGPLYFLRRWKSPLLITFGSVFTVIFIDGYCGAAIIAGAFLFLDMSSISSNWAWFVSGHWLIAGVACLAVFTSLKKSLPAIITDRDFLKPILSITPLDLLKIFSLRFMVIAGAYAAIFCLLMQLDIQLSLAQLLIFIPIIMMSTFLPISAGGYGGPQGAAILFLSENWHVCSPEQALAFSLLWSTLFLIGRLVMGAPFTIAYWNLVQGIKK